MIADFGLSKPLADIKSNSAVLGIPAYVDPQCYINSKYKRSAKSISIVLVDYSGKFQVESLHFLKFLRIT